MPGSKLRLDERECACCGRLYRPKRVEQRFCIANCRVNSFRGCRSKWQRALADAAVQTQAINP